MDIIVNGKKVEHNLGDCYWYIWFRSETGELDIRCNTYEPVDTIEIKEDGIHYISSEGNCDLTSDYMSDNGFFWTKEAAEKYVSDMKIQNKSGFKPGEELFVIANGHVLPVYIRNTDFRLFINGKVYVECETNCALGGVSLYINESSEEVEDPYNRHLYDSISSPVFYTYKGALCYLERVVRPSYER